MQFILVLILLVTRQSMIALMLCSGAVATTIPLILRIRATHEEHATAGTALSPSTTPRDDHDDINTFTCMNLERLLGFDVSNPSSLWHAVVHRWLCDPTLAVPVANTSSGPYRIDLNRQGPHALVAGTTGSGKSVFLQSWCLAMAALNSPRYLRFVFMDFKGGSTFNELAALPHVVGNVCDLNLDHAIRALLALERELKRREHLMSVPGIRDIQATRHREPSLIIVVDEFHALRDQLPDYVGRLVRIASLGRSLGMHIIACTQNPLGQVSSDMKANMSLKFCLRVLDGMQSGELLGGATRGASISPHCPGAAYCNDGERLTPMRAASTQNVGHLVTAIARAFRFIGDDIPCALFTPPLPCHITTETLIALTVGLDPPSKSLQSNGDRGTSRNPGTSMVTHEDQDADIVFALGDDSVMFFKATLPLWKGNIAIIGPKARGKTTLLRHLARQLQRQGYDPRWFVERNHDGPNHQSMPAIPKIPPVAICKNQIRSIRLVDDADDLLDPLSTDRHAQRLREMLHDPNTTVIFSAETSHHIRIPQHCSIRVVFPTGERAIDLADGIPSQLLRPHDMADRAVPGRAVLIRDGRARMIQCPAPL